MAQVRSWLPVCWLALASPLLSEAARAAEPSSEAAVEARREEAKLKFRQGSELFNARQYQKAVTAFVEADRLAPSPALSFNIAHAYEQLGDTSGALRWYRDYLRRSPAAKNGDEVRARIAQLSQTLAQNGVQQLTVLSMPVGALVVVDGRSLGVTPFTGELPLGKHRLQLDLSGYRAAGEDVQLSEAGPQDVQINLEPDSNSGNSSETTLAKSGSNERDRHRFGITPWLVLGAGAASLGGGLGFELARHSQENAARHASTQLDFKDKTDAMSRDQTTARILTGVGGALVVTGTVMLLFNQRAPESPRVGLGCTWQGCTAMARGSF